MSHRNNFEVPAKLRFRPYQLCWSIGMARVIQLSHDRDKWKHFPKQASELKISQDKLDLPGSILIEFGESLGNEKRRFFIDRNLIPSEILCAMEHGDIESAESQSFELLFSEIDTHEGKDPDFKRVPSAKWGRLFLDSCLSRKPGVHDPFEMFEQFMRLPRASGDQVDFMNRWGAWQPQFYYFGIGGKERVNTMFVSPALLWDWHSAFAAALVGKPADWLCSNPPLTFSHEATAPFSFVDTSYCEETIRAVITIKKLQGLSFGICKRHDCRIPFERTSRQKRLYCTPECAHLANVRQLRKKQKRSNLKHKALDGKRSA